MRVGTAYDIPGCMSQPGVAPRRGVVRRRGGGTFFKSLPRHPRPLRRVHLSLLYKPTGCRELGDIIADLLC